MDHQRLVALGQRDDHRPLPTVDDAAGAATAPTEDPARHRATLAVENMTCATCPSNVRRALATVPGVEVVDVTLDPPRALVTYDPDRADLDDLVAATTEIGYPSHIAAR